MLRVDASTDEPEFISIDLADVALVEVQLRAVHLTKKNGDDVLLQLPEHASKFGRALSKAAGTAEPKSLGDKEEFATYFITLAEAGGLYAGYLLTLKGLAAAGLIPIPFPLCLLIAVPLAVFAVFGWFVGELLSLIALRLHLSPEDLRAFVRGYILASKPDKPSWLASLRLHLVQLVSGIPTDPNNPRSAGHGQ